MKRIPNKWSIGLVAELFTKITFISCFATWTRPNSYGLNGSLIFNYFHNGIFAFIWYRIDRHFWAFARAYHKCTSTSLKWTHSYMITVICHHRHSYLVGAIFSGHTQLPFTHTRIFTHMHRHTHNQTLPSRHIFSSYERRQRITLR